MKPQAEAVDVQASRLRVSARDKALILKAVADKHGKLTALLVVQESDPTNAEGVAHTLSAAVGWGLPDAEAARRFREDQARAVIRAVEPELIQLGVIQIAAPYYVHDPAAEPGKQGYVPLASIKSRDEMAEDTLRAEEGRAVAALERAYSIAVALAREEDAAAFFGALSALGRAPAAAAGATDGESASAPA